MATDYNYDEQGQFFPYFVATIAALITIPTTYSALKPSKELENTAPRIQTDFVPSQDDIIGKQRRKQKRKQRKLKRLVIATGGWLVMAWMVYLMVVTTRTTTNIWDPYEILGLSTSASESQIKKHFKKLSITQHPDKRRPDVANNETIESISDQWVEVTKAFKALTDEDIRNNFIQFGHPDGKQSFSIGIALPKFIVEGGNGRFVLLLYAILLGVILPYFVGRWWYGTQRMTRDGILVESAGRLFTEYREDITEGGIIGALSSGAEYEEAINKQQGQGSSKVESRLLKAPDVSAASLIKQDRQRLLDMDDESRRKVLGLLWSYLHRVTLDDDTLDEQKYEVAPIAQSLSESFTSMTLAYGNTQPLLASYHASQHLIQAMPPHASPLLQLPYFNPKVIDAIKASDPDFVASIQNFMSLTDEKRKALTVKAGNLTNSQYSTAMSVAGQIPAIRLEKTFFKVVGERFLTPGSLIQFVVKVRIIPPGTPETFIPEVNPADLEDPDPKEGDLDALHGRKRRQTLNKKTGTMEDQPLDEKVQAPLAHAPYFARDHSPRWRVFLADKKSGKIAVPPFTFSTFERPIFKKNSKGDPIPTCNVQTLKMQFQAPPGPGGYAFTVHIVCDSYVGLDLSQDVIMDISEISRAEEIEDEDEISEPEEDSIAGQMNALKGSEAPRPKRKIPRPAVEEDSDGSNTEGEEEGEGDSDSDTDTDSDEE